MFKKCYVKIKKKNSYFYPVFKKIGYGHYYRSNLIKEKLSNKYDCELKANKSINQTKILLKKIKQI